jgi:hypothetical protein
MARLHFFALAVGIGGEEREAYITALIAADTALMLPLLSAATQMRPESTP